MKNKITKIFETLTIVSVFLGCDNNVNTGKNTGNSNTHTPPKVEESPTTSESKNDNNAKNPPTTTIANNTNNSQNTFTTAANNANNTQNPPTSTANTNNAQNSTTAANNTNTAQNSTTTTPNVENPKSIVDNSPIIKEYSNKLEELENLKNSYKIDENKKNYKEHLDKFDKIFYEIWEFYRKNETILSDNQKEIKEEIKKVQSSLKNLYNIDVWEKSIIEKDGKLVPKIDALFEAIDKTLKKSSKYSEILELQKQSEDLKTEISDINHFEETIDKQKLYDGPSGNSQEKVPSSKSIPIQSPYKINLALKLITKYAEEEGEKIKNTISEINKKDLSGLNEKGLNDFSKTIDKLKEDIQNYNISIEGMKNEKGEEYTVIFDDKEITNKISIKKKEDELKMLGKELTEEKTKIEENINKLNLKSSLSKEVLLANDGKNKIAEFKNTNDALNKEIAKLNKKLVEAKKEDAKLPDLDELINNRLLEVKEELENEINDFFTKKTILLSNHRTLDLDAIYNEVVEKQNEITNYNNSLTKNSYLKITSDYRSKFTEKIKELSDEIKKDESMKSDYIKLKIEYSDTNDYKTKCENIKKIIDSLNTISSNLGCDDSKIENIETLYKNIQELEKLIEIRKTKNKIETSIEVKNKLISDNKTTIPNPIKKSKNNLQQEISLLTLKNFENNFKAFFNFEDFENYKKELETYNNEEIVKSNLTHLQPKVNDEVITTEYIADLEQIMKDSVQEKISSLLLSKNDTNDYFGSLLSEYSIKFNENVYTGRTIMTENKKNISAELEDLKKKKTNLENLKNETNFKNAKEITFFLVDKLKGNVKFNGSEWEFPKAIDQLFPFLKIDEEIEKFTKAIEEMEEKLKELKEKKPIEKPKKKSNNENLSEIKEEDQEESNGGKGIIETKELNFSELCKLENIKNHLSYTNHLYSDNKEYYIKLVPRGVSYNEILAAKFYEECKCSVPELYPVNISDEDFKKLELKNDFNKFDTEKENHVFLASKVLKLKKDDNIATSQIQPNYFDQFKIDEVLNNFIIDVFLGNYDVLGLPSPSTSNLNFKFKKDNNTLYRLDVGASLRYKAQGGPKDTGFNKNVNEFEFLLGECNENIKTTLGFSDYHKEISKYAGYVFSAITETHFDAGIKKLQNITDEKIEEIVKSYGDPLEPEENKLALINLLKTRKQNLLKKTWNDVVETLKRAGYEVPIGNNTKLNKKNEELINFFKNNFPKIRDIYKNFKPHDLTDKLTDEQLWECMNSVYVLYQDPADVYDEDKVKQLNYGPENLNRQLLQRDLVNLSMGNGQFDHTKLNNYLQDNKKSFDIENIEYKGQSYYTEFYEKNKILLPNISIVGRVPYRMEDNLNNVEGFITLLNISGYGFDSSNQPDYKFFNSGKLNDENKFFLKKSIENWFHKMAKAMELTGKKYGYIGEIGLGAFATKLNSESKKWLQNTLWDEFLSASERYKEFNWLAASKIIPTDTNDKRLKSSNIVDNFGFNTGGYCRDLFGKKATKFYESLKNSKLTIDDIMFVNPWDPHSQVGNENICSSVDGMYGYYTGTPIFYPHLNKLLLEKERQFMVSNNKKDY